MRGMAILRARLWLSSLLNPWRVVRQLRDENERLCSVISDPLLTGINIGNGSIDIGMKGGAAEIMAGMFVGMFEKYPDAKNYVEMTFGSPVGGIVVTVQKQNGKTPSDLLKEAKQEVERLNRVLAEARTGEST